MINRHIWSRLGRITGVAVLTATLGLAGCDLDEILEVNDPETVNPGTIQDPDVIEVVMAGAQGDFTSAFSGGDSWVIMVGLITDEIFSSGSFPTRTATDQRFQYRPVEGNTSDASYNAIQFARRSLREVAGLVAEHPDYGATSEEYGELKALEGYTKIMLGESYCSAVPLSTGNALTGEFEFAEPSTSAEVLQSAVSDFDVALGVPDNYLAMVGKGRALLDLAQSQADYAAAAAAVASVPTEWVHYVYHSQSGSNNGFWSRQGNGRYSQSHNEGGGLPFRDGCEAESQSGDWLTTTCDPRTPWWEDPNGGFTPTIPLYRSLKFVDYDSPFVLASGLEARLIQAEALMEANDFAGMTGILNTLRAAADDLLADHSEMVPTEYSLPALAVPGDRAAAIDQLFAERGFWLYMTGHRLGDARRLVYQKGWTEDEAYPSGGYHKGGLDYGDDVVFPLDFDEAVNPNFSHDMCDVQDASIR